MEIRLLCDGLDISKRVKSLKKHIEFTDKNIIGNVSSAEYTAVIDNKDGFLDEEKLNKIFIIELNGILYDTIHAYDYPLELFSEITITFYDNIAKTNIPFITDVSTYPKTIRSVLDEMSNILNNNIDYSLVNALVLDKEVNTYDTNIMIRSYLGWIAELSACNVLCTSNGNIKFFQINKQSTKNIEVDRYVYEFKTASIFNCTRVLFDNGLKVIEQGIKDGNTIYLSEDNLYISDDDENLSVSQAQIDLIYELVNGITFHSITGLKMRSIDDLILGEIIHYKEYFDCIALSYDIDFYNGDLTHNVMTLDGTVDSTEKEKAIIVANTEKKKKINVILDNQSQKLTVLAQDVEGNSKKIGALEVDVTGVRGSVEEVKEMNGTLVERTNDLEITVDGLLNQITTTGGNNLIEDSLGVFGGSWISTNDKKYSLNTSIDVKRRNLIGIAILLNADTITQIITLPDGEYTLSFSYCKHVSLAVAKLKINEQEFDLTNTEYTEFKYSFILNSGSIQIQFISDTLDSCTIVNLMLNQGSVASLWSLSQGEAYSDNFQISKDGASLSSSVSDVFFNMKNDIIGFKNKNTGEYITNFTDVGIDVKEINVKDKAKIAGLLIQEIETKSGMQTVFNRIGR